MEAERRLHREADAPYLEVLRVVQQSHEEQIKKLAEASATMASTQAVHANILLTLATGAQQTAAAIQENRGTIATNNLANAVEHSAIRSGVKLLAWGLPVILTVGVVVANVIVYLVQHTTVRP